MSICIRHLYVHHNQRHVFLLKWWSRVYKSQGMLTVSKIWFRMHKHYEYIKSSDYKQCVYSLVNRGEARVKLLGLYETFNLSSWDEESATKEPLICNTFIVVMYVGKVVHILFVKWCMQVYEYQHKFYPHTVHSTFNFYTSDILTSGSYVIQSYKVNLVYELKGISEKKSASNPK